VVEIEYVKREAAPEPGKTLLHDDWVSAIHSSNDLYVVYSLLHSEMIGLFCVGHIVNM